MTKKKTYAEICIERAEKADLSYSDGQEFLEAQIHSADDVPELARRLGAAVNILRAISQIHISPDQYVHITPQYRNAIWEACDELEAMPKEEGK